MGELENTKVVQGAYAAFGRGDIPGVLSAVADDVDWHGVIGAGTHVPMHGPRRGHSQVAQFFQQVGENLDFKTFEPREFLAQGDKVVTLGHYEGTIKKTQRSMKSDFVMVFTLKNGKIVRFREYLDVTSLNAAF